MEGMKRICVEGGKHILKTGWSREMGRACQRSGTQGPFGGLSVVQGGGGYNPGCRTEVKRKGGVDQFVVKANEVRL